jgi:cytochrome c-type biogenesis protein CcmH
VTRRVLVAFFLCLSFAPGALAVEPDEQLGDPGLEGRARAITRELRCVVCQNQSVDDSDAPLAHDIRVLVREQIKNGDTDDQVRAYLVARYGNFVLLRPPLQGDTIVLWFAPVLFFALGFLLLGRYLQRAPSYAAPLSDTEQRELDRLLEEG